MAGEKTASFVVDLESNAGEVSKGAADELEKLRATIEAASDKVKNYGAALRSLRGASEEVAAAKTDLKAKIEAERGAVSQANLALLKQGQFYEKLTGDLKKADAAQRKLQVKQQTDALKKMAEQTHKLRDGFKAAGGPVADLSEKFGKLKELVGGAGGGISAMGLGVGLLVAGVAALTVALVAATVKLLSFVVESADAMRTLGLMRESMTGSADSGKALGTWVDYLGHRVKLTREELTDLALANDRAFSPARTNVNPKKLGQVVQEVTYAMAQAKAGMGKFGDEASGKLREIVERGKVWGRLRLTPTDLEGTGIKFEEVAEAYAKLNKIPLGQARTALQGYSADVLDVAKAIHAAADTRFARTNAEALLSLDVQWAKFKERLVSLAGSGVLEPLLKGLSRLAYAFDPASESGKRLQATFEKIGTAIGQIDLDQVTKDVEGAIDSFNAMVDSIGDISAIFKALANDPTIGLMITGLKVIGVTIAAIAGAVVLTVAGIALAIGGVWKIFEYLGSIGEKIGEFLGHQDWGAIGKAIIDGIVGGITGAAGALYGAVETIGSKVKSTFKGILGISSPSTVFAGYGVDTAAGYAQGIERGTPRAQGAAADMAPAAPPNSPRPAAAPGGGASAMSPLIVNFEIHAGSSNGPEVVRAIQESSILADLQKAIRQMLISQGVPTQAPV